MFKINDNGFKILTKYKDFVIDLDNYLENIPRKDYYYKDRIRVVSNDLLENILKCSIDNSKDNLNQYEVNIKCFISEIDFLLDRLYIKKYINEKGLYKVGQKLVEINKMTMMWIKNKYDN